MSDNKPPMTAWLGPNQSSPTMDNSGEQFGHYRTVCRGPLIQTGPYVHLEQFMEEVERRAEKRALEVANLMGGEYYCPEYYFADKANELAKEIMEGNAS